MQSLSYYYLEIRMRLLYTLVALVFSIIVSYIWKYEILYIISKPFIYFHNKFIFLDLTEAFYTIVSLTTIFSLLSVLPLLIYHFWSFYIPSCYFSERKKINFWISIFITFFILESFLIYFFIYPKICEFFMTFEYKNISALKFSIELLPRIQSYYIVTFRIFSILLLIFQLPYVFFLIYVKKVVNCYELCKKRKHIVFFSLLSAAFLSPPDFVSQLVLSAIIYIIYEVLIFFGFFFRP